MLKEDFKKDDNTSVRFNYRLRKRQDTHESVDRRNQESRGGRTPSFFFSL